LAPVTSLEPTLIPALLRERGLRATAQRRAVLAAFEAGHAGHLTAEDVFERARRELPELSLATVYNALADLVRAGLLVRLDGTGRHLYDAKLEQHQHFRCRSCGRLFDVHARGLGELALAEDGFEIERTQLVLEGRCPDCRRSALGIAAPT
jgi:Fur family ferric uptake transcriptional regulator